MEYNGYRYIISRKSLDCRYYYCKERKTSISCLGTIKVLNNTTVVVIHEHNHLPMANTGVLRKILVQRAQKDKHVALRDIYTEEAIRFPNEAQNYPYCTAESTMRSARRRVVPQLPHTLTELADILKGHFGEQFCCHNKIYGGIVGDHSVVLCCPHLIDEAINEGAHEIYADGTFKIRPATPGTRQIFTIHVIIQNHSIPLFFVMMKVRTMEAYMELFQYIKLNYMPTLQPSVIMTDYERALQEAFAREFMYSEVRGCHFHYAQAIWRKMSKLNLLNAVNQNLEAVISLKMLMVLPLLPADRICEGLEAVEHYALSHNVEMNNLFQYVRRYWINSVTVERMSVNGLSHRTNNNLESFHNSMKIIMGGSHPNLWKFLGIVTNKFKENHIILNQIKGGLKPTRGSKNKFLLSDHRIKKAQSEFDRGLLSVLEYLKRCSHGVDGFEQRSRLWALHHTGDENESSDEDEIMVISVEPNLHDGPIVEFYDGDNEEQNLNNDVEQIVLNPVVPESEENFDIEGEYSNVEEDLLQQEFRNVIPDPDGDDSELFVSRSLPEGQATPENFPLNPNEIEMIENYVQERVEREINNPEIFHTLDEERETELEETPSRNWRPDSPLPSADDTPDMFLCQVCKINVKQYILECKHTLCGFCAGEIFNHGLNCPFCRGPVNEQPGLIFF